MALQPHAPAPHLPNIAALQSVSIDEMLDATQRLSELLMEEAEHLKAMRVAELAPLQEEKLRLTRLLETAQARMAADPGFVTKANAAQREELLLLADDLAFAVEENFRHVSVARAVNSRVMQAISEVVSDHQRPATYDRSGMASSRAHLTVSLNLNQKA